MLGCRSARSLVAYLDQFIVGQAEAKRSLAIAVTDRSRRMRIADEALRRAIVPSNILLLGPTGCGKTEVARRLARKVEAPFVKVVATKYSEVGFVGEDTSGMIEELAEQAYADEVAKLKIEVHHDARQIALDEVTAALVVSRNCTREDAQAMVERGLVDGEEIELDLEPTLEGSELVSARTLLGPVRPAIRPRKNSGRPITVAQALKSLSDRSAAQLLRTREQDLKERAKESVEQRGIVFIDEFDKMISDRSEEGSSFNQKRRGVEKELLTLIEGTSVVTKKLGPINTDHIVFICAGAFSSVSPKQIMPELQGRLPIRCTMKALSEDDLFQILESIEYSLPRTQRELLFVDGVELAFTECGLRELARSAVAMNKQLVNTGARRLTTVMGIVLEEIKFSVEDRFGERVVVDASFVKERFRASLEPGFGKVEDLRRFVL